MSYLIDTNVVSEIAKRRRNTGVLHWLGATRTDGHHLSVLTIGELMRGIEQVRSRGGRHQVESLERALATIRAEFGSRITPITLDIAEEWARLRPNRPRPVVDALIGATARVRGWTLVTRNVEDFADMGIPLLNPFSEEVER